MNIRIRVLLLLCLLLCVCYFCHNNQPSIQIIRNVLTQKEIDHIQQQAVFKPSMVMGPSKEAYKPGVRVSETAWVDDPTLIHKLLRRAGLYKKTIEHCELLQVVRYGPGGFFKPHNDSIEHPYSQHGHSYFVKGGHRDNTLLIALSDDYEGGETVFPEHGARYKLKKGDALLFKNVDRKGKLINLHGGDQVRSGTKWIVNLWTHEHSVK